MKRRFLLPALVLAAAVLILPAGCSGGNLYEVASREESTVSSLSQGETKTQTRKMYEEALSDGYTKSYVDFLIEIGYCKDDSLAVNSALLSTVEVYAAFERSQYAFGQSANYYSIGSGVLFDLDKAEGDAYVLTNYHVLYSATSTGREALPHISDSITLYLYGGKTRSVTAEYVGGAMDFDIAVLKVEDSDVLRESDGRAASIGDSDAATVGQRVYAVGNADGKGISAVSGILSLEAEYITLTAANERSSISMLEMRTDAPVNHGNSGGGLFDAEGNLLGIVNARSEASGVEHIGYAIPVNLAYAIAENIIDNSKADNSRGAMRATLGVTTGTQDSYSYYDAETGKTQIEETVVFREIKSGIAAGKLKAGDILRSLAINGGAEKKITRHYMLEIELFKVRKGDVLTVTVERNGKTEKIPLTFSDNDDFLLYN